MFLPWNGENIGFKWVSGGNGIDEISADKKPTGGQSMSFLRKR
jgi:hypothetical protein